MKKLLVFLAVVYSLNSFGQSVPPADTSRYLQKSASAIRTDTTANNLLTLNQSNHTVDMMSGATLKSYFQNGLLSANSQINTLSKTASYTIVSGDISLAKQSIIYLAVDCTSGSNTQTLPSATTYAGYKIIVTKTDATANTITISGVALDNIIGVKGTVKEFISLSGNWVNK